MGQDQRAEPRDLKRVARGLGLVVGQAEEDQRRAGVGLVVPLHRGDLRRLVLERVQPVKVADHDLDRRDDHDHPRRHREHPPRRRLRRVAEQVPGPDRADDERGGEVGRQHHVHQPVGEGRVEDHRPPVLGHELAVGVDGKAGRRLHPGVGAQDPEGRAEGADRHHRGRDEVQAGPDLGAAEEHDAEKPGLEEEGREHLVAHQRPEDRPGAVGKHRPVGAELVGHGEPGDDAHAEGDGEDGLPIVEEPQIERLAAPEVQEIQHREVAREPDREGGKDDVKGDCEGELQPREHKGPEIRHHFPPLHAGFRV
jgi:hypothetical protein